MQYFYDLIESYELLKKRKFNIKFRRLHEEVSGETLEKVMQVKAAAGAGQAINGVTLTQLGDGAIQGELQGTGGQRGQVAHIVKSNGQKASSPTTNKLWGIMFPGETPGYGDMKGTTMQGVGDVAQSPGMGEVPPDPLALPPTPVPDTLLDKKGEPLPDTLQLAGQTVANSEYGETTIDPNTGLPMPGGELHDIFRDIAEDLPDLCEKIRGGAKSNELLGKVAERANMAPAGEGGGTDNCGRFFSYIVGAYNASLEYKLSNATGATFDEAGNVLSVKAKVDDRTVQGVGNSIRTIFDILKKDTISDEDKGILQGLLKVDGNRIIIKSSDEAGIADGLVFNEKAHPMGNMLKGVVEGVVEDGFVVQAATFEGDGMKKGDVAWRGLNFERVLTVLNLQRRCIGTNNASLCEAAKGAWRQFRKHAARVVRVHRTWVKAFKSGDSAISEEFYKEHGKAIAELLSHETGKPESEYTRIGQGLASASRKSIQLRRPDAIVTVGTQTGFGKKADTLEAWGSYDEATAALRRQGVPNPEKYIKPMSKADYLANETDPELAGAIGAGLPDQLFTVGISLKNYEQLSDTTLAKFSGKRVSGFISQDAKDEKGEELFRQETHDLVVDRLGMDNTEFKGVQTYQKKLDKIRNTVKGIPAVSEIKFGRKKVKVETLKRSAEGILKALKKETPFKKLIDLDSDVGNLSHALSRIKDWNSPQTSERARQVVTKFLVDRQKNKDLLSGHSSNAVNHLRYEAALISTSDTPILGEGRELNTLNISVFDGNDLTYDALNGIKNGTHSIQVTKSGSVKIVEKGEQGNSISFRRGARSKGVEDDPENPFTRETTLAVHVSEGQVNKHSFMEREDASTSFIIEFEKNQMLLVETLKKLFNQASI